jgi:uncharacterized protein (TIGR03086 family)
VSTRATRQHHTTDESHPEGTTTMIDHLEQALRSTGAIVSGIRPDQWVLPTPCAGWDVRTECNHLVGGLRIFTAQLEGHMLDADHEATDWLGDDPAAAYTSAAAADAIAWRAPGATDTFFDLAFGRVPGETALVVHLTEVLVHGLDLAVATGQDHLADETGTDGAGHTSLTTDDTVVPAVDRRPARHPNPRSSSLRATRCDPDIRPHRRRSGRRALPLDGPSARAPREVLGLDSMALNRFR